MTEASGSKTLDGPIFSDIDEYFMAIALLCEKCNNVGACIVDNNNRLISIGYNKCLEKCECKICFTQSTKEDPQNRNLYVCHAEADAIANRIPSDLQNSTMYVTLFPCCVCAQLIVQSGIKEVIYARIIPKETNIAVKKMFHAAGVIHSQFNPRNKQICIKL